jgi:type IV secretory pathway VirB10-like protein
MRHVLNRTRALCMLALVTVVAAASIGCPKEEKKPESTAAAASAAKPAASPAAEKASAAPAASSAAAKKKPASKKAPVEKAAPQAKKEVPSEWEERDHAEKGFSFWVPKGVKETQATEDGVDVYMAQLPAPHDAIGVFVMAFKGADKKFPELTTITEKLIKNIDKGDDYKVVKTDPINDSYEVLEITYKDKDGKLNTVKALLALDVTDRYIVIAGGAGELKDSEETVDTILANFEMYASGKGE